MKEKAWLKDPTIIRIMKLRKRHVRLCLERIEAQREAANTLFACPTCGKPTKGQYEEGEYRGHVCPSGHVHIVSKRLRDPLAPRVSTEKADVRALPSQGKAPPPMTAQEARQAQDEMRRVQQLTGAVIAGGTRLP